MSSKEQEQNPFTRPGFIAAAGVIALIITCALVLMIINMTKNSTSSVAPTGMESAPSEERVEEKPVDAENNSSSICGLPENLEYTPLVQAPETTWAYQDTEAYPSSSVYGPGKISEDGVRYCYQHSVEGALVAAANIYVHSSDLENVDKWGGYFLSKELVGREQLLQAEISDESTNLRFNIAGFRVLEYSEKSAKIDIAFKATSQGEVVYGSSVLELVWEESDWKLLPSDLNDPLRITQLPDVTGYISWGE